MPIASDQSKDQSEENRADLKSNGKNDKLIGGDDHLTMESKEYLIPLLIRKQEEK